MSGTQKYWFATHTRDKQEPAICKSLPQLKSEGHSDVDYYLSIRTVVSQLRYHHRHSGVPAIRNLVFVRITKQTACGLSNVYGVRLLYMKDFFAHSMLAVPDRQMFDFIFVMGLNPDGTGFNDGSLVVGDRVCVVKDDLTDAKGKVATSANRTYVIIRIKDILTTSVKVPKSHLKVIK